MKHIFKTCSKTILSTVLVVALLASCSGGPKKPVDEILTSGKLLPSVTTDMHDYKFWTSKDKKSNETLLDSDAITALNAQLQKSMKNTEIDLTTVPTTIAGEELVSLIEDYKLPAHEYVNGKPKDAKFESTIVKTIGTISIPAEVTASYGILVSNSALKMLPTTSVLMKSASDWSTDYLLKETLKLGDGVLVYHQTYDKKYSFVQSSKGHGWVLTSTIATTTKEEFTSFLSPSDFIVVTTDKLNLQNTQKYKNLSKTALDMGTKLPISQFSSLSLVDEVYPVGNYQVSVPIRNKNGNLSIAKTFLPVNDDVSFGYLPFTKENLLKQTLSLVGNTAGNNGYLNHRDNGLTIESIYSVFGINLPDNFDDLNKITAKKADMSEFKTKDKIKQIKKLTSGSILLSDDHVAIYVGTYDDNIVISHVVEKAVISDTLTSINSNLLSTVNISLDDVNTFIDTCKYSIDFTVPDAKK